MDVCYYPPEKDEECSYVKDFLKDLKKKNKRYYKKCYNKIEILKTIDRKNITNFIRENNSYEFLSGIGLYEIKHPSNATKGGVVRIYFWIYEEKIFLLDAELKKEKSGNYLKAIERKEKLKEMSKENLL